MKTSGWIAIGLLAVVGAVLAGAGFVSAQTAADADFDGSGDVGFQDFLLFAAKFNTSEGDGDYEAKFDIDGNGSVGFTDFLAFARFFGETVPLPPLALTGVAPAEGMPGTLIELLGQFDVNTAYQVRFDAVSLPVDVQDTTRITAMVPVLPAGSLQVRVVDALGRESESVSFEVLALPEPRLNAQELRQAVSGIGTGVGNVLAPLTVPDSIFSAPDAAFLKGEMDKLNAAWGVLGQRIDALSQEDAALLAHLLDNSGAMGILEGLGKVDLSASKAVGLGAAYQHQNLFNADVISFLMGNASAATSMATVIAAVVPGGQALVPILAAIDAISGATKSVIDAIFPTDLENLRVEISPNAVPVEGTSEVSYFGDFVTESDAIREVGGRLLEEAVEEILQEFLKIPIVSEAAAEEIVGFVSGILSAAGMKGFDWVTRGATLSPALKDLPLDMSVYKLSVFDILQVIPTLPGKSTADAIEYLLEKAGIDVTFYDPVEIEDDKVAVYDEKNAQLTGKTAGTTRLKARAIRFEEWDHPLNLIGINKWTTVGPVYANIEVGTNFTGIAANDHGQLYLLHHNSPSGGGAVFEARKNLEGSYDYSRLFILNSSDVEVPSGIATDNKSLYVVGRGPNDNDSLVPLMVKYSENNGRWEREGDRIALVRGNHGPTGATYASGAIHVVDADSLRVYVYGYNKTEGRWHHHPDLFFELDGKNDNPQGITYVNERFYVVDAGDDWLYAYSNTGDRVPGADLKLTGDVGLPYGIASANGLVYVVDNEYGTIREYGNTYLSVDRFWIDDPTLTTGRKRFTVHSSVSNRGIAPARNAVLRFYRSDDRDISPSDDHVIYREDLGTVDRTDDRDGSYELAVPDAGTYYYGACVDFENDERETVVNCYHDAVEVRVVFGGRPASENVAVYSLESDNGLPEGVASATSGFYVVDADSTVYAYDSGWTLTSEFKLTAANGLPTGVAYAGDRLYVVDRENRVYAYDASGTSISPGFDLGTGRLRARGMVYADGRFHAVHSNVGRLFFNGDWNTRVSAFVHDSGQFRKLPDEFGLHEDNDSPAGIADADSLFFVVDSEYEKVYAYDRSWTHTPALDFTLHSSNTHPSGITYANNRFFVVDSRDSLVYRYPKPEQPDLVVVSLAASDSTLAPGDEFTLSATVKNAGNVASDATTLRYYLSDDPLIDESDAEQGTAAVGAIAAQDTSLASITLTALSNAGVVFYRACIDAVEGEEYRANNCSEAVRLTVRDSGPAAGGPLVVESISRLTQINQLNNECCPAWSPDGRHIAFSRIVGAYPTFSYAIYVMGSDGSNPRNLTNHVTGRQDSAPAWSPDGRHIAFTSNRGMGGTSAIYVMGSDGSNPRRLTNHARDRKDTAPAWSPDGRHIAFSRTVGDYPNFNYAIYVMDSDGSNPRRLTNHPGDDFGPTWSPDGRHIAFSREHHDATNNNYNTDIFVMGSDGSNPRRLTNVPERDRGPGWSPDGRHIAFTSQRGVFHGVRGSFPEIYVMGSDGSNQRRLINPQRQSLGSQWSPDGRQIACRILLDDWWGIFVITLRRGDEEGGQ